MYFDFMEESPWATLSYQPQPSLVESGGGSERSIFNNSSATFSCYLIL